jgi:integrase
MIKNIGRKKYLVRVYDGRDAAGKRVSTSQVVHGGRDVAEALELELLQKKSKGQPLSESRLTVSAFFKKWHQAKAQSIKERTHIAYGSQFVNHIEQRLGHVRLTALRPGDVEEFYAEKLRSGLSGRSVEYLHSILASMYADAARWRDVAENPMRYVRSPKRQKKEMMCFTPADTRKFLAATRAEGYGLIFRFALQTGLRPEEYTGLKWPDIDFEYRDRAGVNRGRVSVRRTVIPGKPGGGWWDSVPKSDAGYREVVFPAELLRELREHRARQLEHKMSLGAAYEDYDLVFATPVGTPVDARMLSARMYKRTLKAAGLSEKFRLYDLRHSWVTLSIMAGSDIKTVSRQAGHASVAFTLQVYAHVLPEMREAASDRLEALLKSGAQ